MPALVNDWSVVLVEIVMASPLSVVPVASCICLYGLGYFEAVPRDTWIKKAEERYSIEWDPAYGGIQQQYIFAWMRKTAQAEKEQQ